MWNFTFALLVLFLLVYWPIRQVLDYYRAQEALRFAKAYRHFQLRCIRTHYEELSELSFQEIERRYIVDDWYEHLGRKS